MSSQQFFEAQPFYSRKKTTKPFLRKETLPKPNSSRLFTDPACIHVRKETLPKPNSSRVFTDPAIHIRKETLPKSNSSSFLLTQPAFILYKKGSTSKAQ